MNEKDRQRLKDICRRSKLGQFVSVQDMRWSSKMFQKYPDEYEEVYDAGSTQAIREYLGGIGVHN